MSHNLSINLLVASRGKETNKSVKKEAWDSDFPSIGKI